MSVRLLAGPFPVVSPKGTSLTYSLQDWTWYPGIGFLLSGVTTAEEEAGEAGFQHTYLMTLDGVVTNFCRGPRSWSWWPAKQRLIDMAAYRQPDGTYETMELVFEPIAMVAQAAGPEKAPSGIITFLRYVKLADRRIYTNSFKMYRQVEGVVPDVPEYDFYPFFPDEVLPGRSEHDMWVPGASQQTGSGCFYDTVMCRVSSPVYKIATLPYFNFLGYAPEYGVLFSIHATGPSPTIDQLMVRIWSLEVHPTILTVPEAFIGTPKSGQVVTYRVRVTGDDDDGAENELVNWSLTGAGVLLDVQTKADADGYATARVQYGLGESGSSTVEARVLC